MDNNILEIFHKGIESKRLIIKPKPIKVDINKHAKGILNIAKHFCRDFQITNDLKPVMGLMLLYFTSSDRFESEFKRLQGNEGSLQKGLFLMGGVGTGKTILFKIFREYAMNVIKANGFREHKAADVIKDVKENGTTAIRRYVICPSYQKPFVCYFDDLAASTDEINDYGTKVNVMEQVFTDRYIQFQRNGVITHASSNMFPKQLEKVYDVRIIDRFKEMFNFIELNGKSFRK